MYLLDPLIWFVYLMMRIRWSLWLGTCKPGGNGPLVLETVTSAAVTDPVSGLSQGLACGTEWCFSGCRCLPSAWTSVGRSQTCSVCTGLFILFYLQTFRYRELGFCGSGGSLTMVLMSVWRAARPWAGHIASLNFHVLIYEFRTRWLTSNDFQVPPRSMILNL